MKRITGRRLGIAMAVSAAIFAGCRGGPAPRVGAAERAVFPRAADLAGRHHLKLADPASNETFAVGRSWDGSIDVDYVFDGSASTAGCDPLYIRGTASLQPTRKDAVLVEKSFRVGMRIGGMKDGLVLRPLPGFAWGDAAEVGVLATPRGNVGSYVIARRDRRVWMLLVVGGACETNATEWGAFVQPWLDRFEDYRGPAAKGSASAGETQHTGLASPESHR